MSSAWSFTIGTLRQRSCHCRDRLICQHCNVIHQGTRLGDRVAAPINAGLPASMVAGTRRVIASWHCTQRNDNLRQCSCHCQDQLLCHHCNVIHRGTRLKRPRVTANNNACGYPPQWRQVALRQCSCHCRDKQRAEEASNHQCITERMPPRRIPWDPDPLQ